VAVFFIDPSSLGCTCGRGSGDFLVRSSTLGNRVNVVNLKHDPMVIRRTRPAFCTAAVITFQYVPPGSGAFRGGESDRSAELTGCSAASGRFGVTLDNITFGEVIPKRQSPRNLGLACDHKGTHAFRRDSLFSRICASAAASPNVRPRLPRQTRANPVFTGSL